MKNRSQLLLGLTAAAVSAVSSAAYGQVNNIWTGDVSSEWNTPGNWSLGVVPTNTPAPGQHAVVNSTPTNIATISSDIAATPVDIFVGTGGGVTARLDHTAGNAATGATNWMYVGHDGASGTYNLADTTATGGVHTGYGLGSGSMNVGGRLYIGGFAGSGSNAVVNVNTSGTLAIGSQLQVGTNGSTGVLNLDAGTISTTNWTEFGNGVGTTGTLNMSGGTFNKTGSEHVIIGANGGTGIANVSGGQLNITNGLWIGNNTGGGNGSQGTFNFSGGTLDKTGSDHFVIGRNGATGTATISGGSITANNEIWVGQAANSQGTMNFSAGTITNNSWVAIGREGGQGTLNMTGGTWNKTGESNFIVGASGDGVTSTMNMSGGVVNVAPHANADRGITWLGEMAGVTGVLNLSGTAEFNTERMTLGVTGGENPATGIANLNGGTLRINQLTGGAGIANVTFNGTQIIAQAATGAIFENLDQAVLGASGLLLDTNGHNVGTAQSFTGTGGIIKSGDGILTLTGTSTYSGETLVSAGTLLNNGTLGNTLVTVNSGATAGGSGTFGGDVAAFGTVAPAGIMAVAGNLAFAADSTLAANLSTELVSLDRINLAGNLTVDPTAELAISLLGTDTTLSFGAKLVVIDYDGIWNGGSFEGYDHESVVTVGMNQFYVDYTDAAFGGSAFTLTAIPEPSATLLCLAGAGLLLRRRRKA